MTFFSKKHTGFTLIEILIALFIFAILGTVSAVGIRTVINSHRRIEKIHQALEAVQFATAQMRVDFIQIIPRPIVGSNGEPLPALLISSIQAIEFTTGGYANPQARENRGTLRRVAYTWENGQLIRSTWSVLDRSPSTKLERRILLKNVTDFSLNYVNDVGSLVNVWVTNNPSQPDALIALPRAIVVTMHIATLGVWQGVFPIPSRGYGVS